MACAIITSYLPTCIILVYQIMWIEGHGRLVEPPSRSSMWRYGFNTPINYDDNQLFCGGYDVRIYCFNQFTTTLSLIIVFVFASVIILES